MRKRQETAIAWESRILGVLFGKLTMVDISQKLVETDLGGRIEVVKVKKRWSHQEVGSENTGFASFRSVGSDLFATVL